MSWKSRIKNQEIEASTYSQNTYRLMNLFADKKLHYHEALFFDECILLTIVRPKNYRTPNILLGTLQDANFGILYT